MAQEVHTITRRSDEVWRVEWAHFFQESFQLQRFCDLDLHCAGSNRVIHCHKLVLASVCPGLKAMLTPDEVDSLILADFEASEVQPLIETVYESLGRTHLALSVDSGLVRAWGWRVQASATQDGDFRLASDGGPGPMALAGVKVEAAEIDPDDLRLGTGPRSRRRGRAPASPEVKAEMEVDEALELFASVEPAPKRRRGPPRSTSGGSKRGRAPTVVVQPEDLEEFPLPMRGSRFERVVRKDGEVVYESPMATEVMETLSPQQLTRKIRHAKAIREKKTQIESFRCECPEFSHVRTFRDREAHYRLHHCGDKYAQCAMCKRVMLKSHWEEHRQNCSDELSASICPHCGKACKSLNALNTHINGVHKVWTCKVCQVDFNGYIKYRRHHLAEHTKPWHCDKCTMVFKAEQNLKDHYIRVHLPHHMRPFVCELCGHGFIYKDKLKIHMMNMHVRTRPHTCRCGCDFAFNDPSTRRAHERKQHPQHPLNLTKKSEL